MHINLTYAQPTVDAGNNKTICGGESITIGGFPAATGGSPPYTYMWIPNIRLGDPNIANPIASPINSVTYTLIVTDALNATNSDTVNIKTTPLNVDAGNDTTIYEGTTLVLKGTGGYGYKWTPTNTLKIFYGITANPQAEPKVTTTYYLTVSDSTSSCYGEDSVTISVIPNNQVTFYNTITPNDDEYNDEWYIGNIEKYPHNHLEIYNRNGKKVFETDNYQNTWNGTSYGEKLPAATYFFILDLGDGQGTHHGSVSIVY